MSRGVCERHGCGRPHKARGLCQRHYDEERGDSRNGGTHRHRILEQRARNRAEADLVRRHREEYLELLEVHRAEAKRDAEQYGAWPLKPGPRAPDEGMTERLLELVCPRCAAAHAADDTCPACGTALHRRAG